MAPTGAEFVAKAKSYVGVPYVWGGRTPAGFDCSGLVYYCLNAIGLTTSAETTYTQWPWCEHLGGQNDLLPGDLIYETPVGASEAFPGHVVIWAGGGQVVESPHTGEDVQVRGWSPSEASQVGYARVPGLSVGAPPPPAALPVDDISTMSSNGVVSLSFRPGSCSHVQVTTDLGGPGPLELRVVLALSTGPWVQYGGGGGSPDFAVSNGYGNFAIASPYAAACGGVTLEASQPTRVFSAAAY